jgi:SAM-dependent methyltransferase
MAALGLTARLFEDDTELSLLRLALTLGAEGTGGPLSVTERQLLAQAQVASPPAGAALDRVRVAIVNGGDPLGEMLSRMRTADQRRTVGAFYTPPEIVKAMVDWVLSHDPQRVVDAGCGSGRFAAEVARRSPATAILAVDIDPVATILTRAALSILGTRKATVIQGDYATWSLPPADGRTAFIGNPPYVRHHDLSVQAKTWAIDAGRLLGQKVSGLSGLHAHFYLATLLKSQPGDIGCFVTSAEWLDVGYGSALRALFLNGLGGQALHIFDPSAFAFADVQTTAVIACFACGTQVESIQVARVSSPEDLRSLGSGHTVPRTVLADTLRWSSLLRPTESVAGRDETVPLRSLARVHRGLVTGANDYFILDRERAIDLGLLPWCRPAITEGREILQAGGVLRNGPERKLLLDVPRDVDRLRFPALDAYLRHGEQEQGGETAVTQRYIASRRKPWWYLGRQHAAPIVASYMARQAPAFALNPDGMALVNIGHGLFPIKTMSGARLESLCSYLNANRAAFQGKGRTYQGGLEKFEPSEMEGLPIDATFLERE